MEAISNREKIVIFGDYDADGIPGASILHSFFKKIGYEHLSVYIPDRYEEKYGLSVSAIEKFAESGVSVVISVDCGITDFLPAARARELDIDLIITDHHLPHEKLPDAFAIINHKKPGDEYPFKFLSGSGTAFKLAQALVTRKEFGIEPGWEKWLLDLAAIATVCDMVPLIGENRAIVHFGLRVLRQTRRPGLVTLFRKTRLNTIEITEDDIAFTIGPRINIASRMSHGNLAFELLTTEDWVRARSIVDQLEKYNEARKGLVQEIIKEVKGSNEVGAQALIFAGNPNWRLGIISATANRLLEEYKSPICLWTINGKGEIKGSVRSDGSVHVLELFEASGGRELFIDYGGHEHSGGFSVTQERLSEFETRLREAYELLRSEKMEKETILESVLDISEINENSFSEINRFAPFGKENPKPHFSFPDLTIKNVRLFGKNGNSHLELLLTRGESSCPALAFFSTPEKFGNFVREGKQVNLVGTLERNTFNGKSEFRLRIVDITPMS